MLNRYQIQARKFVAEFSQIEEDTLTTDDDLITAIDWSQYHEDDSIQMLFHEFIQKNRIYISEHDFGKHCRQQHIPRVVGCLYWPIWRIRRKPIDVDMLTIDMMAKALEYRIWDQNLFKKLLNY